MGHLFSEKYKEMYSQGLIDRSNSLDHYNQFLQNMNLPGLGEQVILILKRKPVARVFDLGCGTGSALKDLKERFKEKIFVSGMDLIMPEKKLDETLTGNALDIEFPAEIDLLVSFRSLHEIAHFNELMPKIAKSLTSKGKAILSIRVRQPTMDSFTFTGEMNALEEKFLKQLLAKKNFKNCKVSGNQVFKENMVGKKEVVGINLILEKK